MVLAASASAPAWLPLEWVTTPAFSSAFDSWRMLFMAPLNLNAPPFWNVSHLKKSSIVAPSILSVSSDIMSSIEEHVCTGVTFANGAMRFAASLISLRLAYASVSDLGSLGLGATFWRFSSLGPLPHDSTMARVRPRATLMWPEAPAEEEPSG